MAEITYMGPVRGPGAAGIAGAKLSGSPPVLKSPGMPREWPAGTALIAECQSGYDYRFWHVVFVTSKLVLTPGQKLGGGSDMYCGKYRQYLSDLQGLHPDEVRYLIPGSFKDFGDIPAEYFDLTDGLTGRSLDGESSRSLRDFCDALIE